MQDAINHANDKLLGRKIISVRYLTEVEAQAFQWNHSCVVIELDDGAMIFPSVDNDGSEAGALHYNKNGHLDVIPII